MEQENLSPRYRRPGADCLAPRGRTASGGRRKWQSTEAGHRGGTARSSEEGPVMGLERRGRADQGQPGANPPGEEPRARPRPDVKPFEIGKRLIYEAWERVRANKGAPGVDAVSIGLFGQQWRDNLYKLWNRMSSGSYFPGPVRGVEIPKDGGAGVRLLGVANTADRVAQTAAAMLLDAELEPVFHRDSYGNRPGSHEHTSFDFLGYTFRGRLANGPRGYFTGFSPAISTKARKAIGTQIRAWHLNRRSGTDLSSLAGAINPQVRGWINYYGAFYRSELRFLAWRVNEHLARWAMHKFKRLRGKYAKAMAWLQKVYQHQPRLFAHWQLVAFTSGRAVGAG